MTAPALVTDDIAEFAAALPPYRALAGLDLGTKTIGVALSDARRSVASPGQGSAHRLRHPYPSPSSRPPW